jgi:lipopolysaccharide/colanic/teichoic acid biosynthesis glycosyltransferase
MINEMREQTGQTPPQVRRIELSSLDRCHKPVLGEDPFRGIFCWERKRAERSGKPFLLMLLHVERLLSAGLSEQALLKVNSALYFSTRETDVAGWYRDGAILGVLFTEIDKQKGAAAEKLLRVKVTEALRARLGDELAGWIHLSSHIFPETTDSLLPGPWIDEKLYPDLAEQDQANKVSHILKRTIDIAGSILALTVCSPLLAMIAVAIKLTSKGPVLFKQQRVGRYGQWFMLLKFRSMKCESDPGVHWEYVRRLITGESESARTGPAGGKVYKIQDDPRITWIGKLLRRTSLDEVPQFFNVLKGEMSLVGPRPPIPYEVEMYQVWHRRRVLEAKPGITGLWQVNGRSKVKFDDMVRLDLQYARTWTFWSDVKILLRTPRAMFFGEGAY